MDYIRIFFLTSMLFATDALPIVLNTTLDNYRATGKMRSKNSILMSKKKVKFTSIYLLSAVWIVLVSLGFLFYCFLCYFHTPKLFNRCIRKKSYFNKKRLRKVALLYKHINLRYHRRKSLEQISQNNFPKEYKSLNTSNSRPKEGDQISCEEKPKSGFCCCCGKKKGESLDDTIYRENVETSRSKPRTGSSPQRPLYTQPGQYQQGGPIAQQPIQKRYPSQTPITPMTGSPRSSQVHTTVQDTPPKTHKKSQPQYNPETISPPQHLPQPAHPRPVSNMSQQSVPPPPPPQHQQPQQQQQPQYPIQYQQSQPPPPPQPKAPQMIYQNGPPIRQQQQPMYQNPPASSPRTTPQRGPTTQKTSTSMPIQSYGGSSNVTSEDQEKTSPSGCCAAKKKSIGAIHPQVQAYKVEGHLRVKGKINKETISIPSDTYFLS